MTSSEIFFSEKFTKDNKKDSVVTKKLKQEKPLVPFFS